MPRVVITGIGLETCAGRDLDTFWETVSTGTPAIGPIAGFDASGLSCQVAGEVAFAPTETLEPMQIRRTSRFQQLHYSAVAKAVQEAGVEADRLRSSGIFVGTALGGIADVLRYYRVTGNGMELLDRLMVTKAAPNAAAHLTSELLDLHGPSLTFTTTCAASTDAIAQAFREIRAGRLETAIASGVEAWITPTALEAFTKMHVTTTCPPESAAEACRPFDVSRDGVTPSEGAAALILESMDVAQARGARVFAEVLGAGSSSDGTHPVRPCPTGEFAALAVNAAVEDAGLTPEQIDHINCHGTSTPLNDVAETLAIRESLGAHADRVSVTASKSVFGHHFGASGAVETAVVALTLANQFVPPTANLRNPDEQCDLDYVTGHGRSVTVDHALKLNFGFGGQNSVLVLGRCEA